MATKLGSKAESVFVDLSKKIEVGKIDEGRKMPSFQEICKTYSVSLGTARQAVAALKDKGLVTSRRGAGLYVNKNSSIAIENNILAVMGICGLIDLSYIQTEALARQFLYMFYFQEDKKWSPEEENNFIRILIDNGCRKLIAFLSPTNPARKELLTQFTERGGRIIHIGYYDTELPEEEYILPDYFRAGYAAASRMLVAGYKKLFFLIQGAVPSPWLELLENGMKACLNDHCMDFSSEYNKLRLMSITGSEQQGTAEQFFLEEMQKNPGEIAVFSCSNWILKALQETLNNEGFNVDQVGCCVCNITDEREDIECDSFDFDLSAISKIATTSMLTGKPALLRKLIAPKVTIRGSL